MTPEIPKDENRPRNQVTDRALGAPQCGGSASARSVVSLRHLFDETPRARLRGAAFDHDTEKETEGCLLDHPDAVIAASC